MDYVDGKNEGFVMVHENENIMVSLFVIRVVKKGYPFSLDVQYGFGVALNPQCPNC